MYKTVYELRISDWSSDVCSSDLQRVAGVIGNPVQQTTLLSRDAVVVVAHSSIGVTQRHRAHVVKVLNPVDRKSVVQGKSVSVSVDIGGRSIIKKTKTKTKRQYSTDSIVTTQRLNILLSTT